MDVMDLDIDMDVDVDLVPDELIVNQLQDTPSPGEIIDPAKEDEPDANDLQPAKIFIQGLDVLNAEELKAFIAEHFPDGFDRTEWIDDSSANLLFRSESTAQEALIALASVEIGDVTQLPVKELLPAKRFSKRTEVSLQIRFAVASDKKQAGAAQRSRFYLLNPQYDPENRKRRYRDRDGEAHGRNRGRGAREDEPIDHFDVNLYDDSPAALATRSTDPRPRRRRSYTPEYDSDDRSRRSSHRHSNRSKELFPSHTGDRSGSRRDRSASPARDRNGDFDMDDISSEGSAARNRRGARAIKDRLTRNNRAKELFPSTLFSGSDRLDDAEELSSRFTLPLLDGSGDLPPPPKRLADRITVPGKGVKKLANGIANPAEASGFSIRGAAKQQKGSDLGFAIKGSAGKSVKELFPDKFGSNTGKELFSDRLDGRSRQRQKAGDLFD